MPDPDRFFDFPTPGAQEWWYFDAISADGRDALVLIWYCGLPFDPDYGRKTLRHLRKPGRHPAPRAVDHSAIGISWYRDGKTLAYALNGHPAADFSHQTDPFAITVGTSRASRDAQGYRLQIDTPAVDGRHRVVADLRFRPADSTIPVERNLGSPEYPHQWILVAADCRVDGQITVEGPHSQGLDFQGRGYHDHNAGAEEISRAMRSWLWGRVHHGAFTEIHYQAEPRVGTPSRLWITCRDGAPEAIRDDVASAGPPPRLGPFGLRTQDPTSLSASRGDTLEHRHRSCVDDGPFYRRWLSDYGDFANVAGGKALGFSEQLDPRFLHHPLVRWMIPYRWKRQGD